MADLQDYSVELTKTGFTVQGRLAQSDASGATLLSDDKRIELKFQKPPIIFPDCWPLLRFEMRQQIADLLGPMLMYEMAFCANDIKNPIDISTELASVELVAKVEIIDVAASLATGEVRGDGVIK